MPPQWVTTYTARQQAAVKRSQAWLVRTRRKIMSANPSPGCQTGGNLFFFHWARRSIKACENFWQEPLAQCVIWSQSCPSIIFIPLVKIFAVRASLKKKSGLPYYSSYTLYTAAAVALLHYTTLHTRKFSWISHNFRDFFRFRVNDITIYANLNNHINLIFRKTRLYGCYRI